MVNTHVIYHIEECQGVFSLTLALKRTNLLVIGWHKVHFIFMIDHRNMTDEKENDILNHIYLYVRLRVILIPRYNSSF